MRLYDFRTEYRENPLGLATKHPRFSWKIASDENDTIQTSYRILVTDQRGRETWNSGPVQSDQSILVPYGGRSA